MSLELLPMSLEPGTWLIFGVVLLPVYAVFLGWFLGKPRDLKVSGIGIGYFVGLTVALWAGLFVLSMVIRFAFF